jgi:hypothetical protein
MGGGEGVGLSELSYICNALNVRTLFPTLFKAGQLKPGIDFWGIRQSWGKVGVLFCLYEVDSIVGTMYIVKCTYIHTRSHTVHICIGKNYNLCLKKSV